MEKRRPRRPITDDEIERRLETMFGMTDGADSEDGLEDSDTDESLGNLLQSPVLEPEFADTLLTSYVTRRRGKHGKEQATSEWEEYEGLEDITDCESENDEDYVSRNTPGMPASATHSTMPASATPLVMPASTTGIDSGPHNITPNSQSRRSKQSHSFASQAITALPSNNNEIAIDSHESQPTSVVGSRTRNTTASQNTRSRATHATASRAITPPSASANDEGGSSDPDGTESDEDETEWKKTDWTNTPDVSSFDEYPLRPTNNFPSRSGPLAYFEVFFDAEIILNLVNQTNLFATQKNARNFAPITEKEIKAYIGMLIQMGIHKLPSIEDYWSSDPALCVPEIAETMTLQRFQKNSNYLHINDNEQMPRRGDANFDKLYKIRPLLDKINQNCQNNAKNTKSQSIDESMVKFKGRSALKQYMFVLIPQPRDYIFQ